MSFDIYFIAMKHGNTPGIPMQETLKAFEGRCDLEKKTWQLNGQTLVSWNSKEGDWKWGSISVCSSNEDDNLCSGINVNRPTPDPIFWKTMFDLMKKFPLGMVFPSDNARWIIANESFREEFPPDQPVEIVDTVEALLESINR